MTACTASFSISVSPAESTASAPAEGAGGCTAGATAPAPVGNLVGNLVQRLAARISSGLDEIVPFATAEAAERAIAGSFAMARKVCVALAEDSSLASRVRACAAGEIELGSIGERRGDAPRSALLDALVRSAQDADAVFIEAPLGSGASVREPLAPRELLALRARAPRPVIVLDLRNEDLARVPLTQAALLIPGTVILRGFGALWAREGAVALARTAFVAGSPQLVSRVAAQSAATPPRGAADIAWSADLLERAVRELDAEDLDRRVQSAARSIRLG